jgi:hypothetical protein
VHQSRDVLFGQLKQILKSHIRMYTGTTGLHHKNIARTEQGNFRIPSGQLSGQVKIVMLKTALNLSKTETYSK